MTDTTDQRSPEEIERDIGPIEVLLFNIGANVPCSILEETARKYFKIWEMACYAGFLTGQAVAQRMAARRRASSASCVGAKKRAVLFGAAASPPGS